MDKSNEVFTTGEVAKLCGVTLRTVINWIQRGHIEAYKLPGTRGDHRISREALLAFIFKFNMPIPRALSAGASAQPQTDSRLVLVVDDDAAMAKSIARVLKRDKWQAVTTQNAFEAGLFYADRKPALMTLDLQMPKMNGFEILRLLQHDNRGKILVISGMRDEYLEQALDLGADGVLAKPFEDDALLAKAQELLN